MVPVKQVLLYQYSRDLRFRREAADDVSGECDARNAGEEEVDELLKRLRRAFCVSTCTFVLVKLSKASKMEYLAGVLALHVLEHLVAATLDRDV